MHSVRRPGIGLGVVLVLTACAQPINVASTGSVTESRVQEIPITTSSSEARSHFMAGERELDAGRGQEANRHFKLAIEQDPDFAYAYLNVAATAASAQEFKEYLDRAATRVANKSDGERLLLEINRTFLDNNADRRLELAQTLVRTYPNSPRAWLNLGGTQAGLRQFDAARESYRRALSIDPAFFPAHVALATSYAQSDPRDLAQAKQHAERAITANPASARGYEILGDVTRAMNRLPDARDAYTRAVQAEPAHIVATLKKGHINSFLGNYNEARSDYDAAVNAAQGQAKITYRVYRAFTNVHAGDARAAIDELTTVAQSVDAAGLPADQVAGAKVFPLTQAFIIALHNEMTSDAQRLIDPLKSAIRADAMRVNDAAYARQGEAAVTFWEGMLAAHTGDYTTAQSKAEQLKQLVEVERNPRKLEGYHTLLGVIDYRKGNVPQAIAHFRQGDLTDVYEKYRLALALEKAGQKEEARKIFREVADWNFNSVGFALARKDAMKRATATN